MKSAMQNSGKRWFIAVMATLVNLCLGTVYVEFFQKTVSETFGLDNSETVWAFSLAILCWVSLQVGADKIYRNLPRKLALIGSFLYAFGYIISCFFKTKVCGCCISGMEL